jgi:hypothetical protein
LDDYDSLEKPLSRAVFLFLMCRCLPQKRKGGDLDGKQVNTLGQIDSSNDLTDDLKNQITKIVYDAHFPQSILTNLPIIIVNNLALTGNQ